MLPRSSFCSAQLYKVAAKPQLFPPNRKNLVASKTVLNHGGNMRNRFGSALIAGVLLAPGAGLCPARSHRPARSRRPNLRRGFGAPIPPRPDMAKNDSRPAGGKEAGVGAYRRLACDLTYESLNQLIAYAYKARAYEISGPDWLVTDRFDIVARMPDGASRTTCPPCCVRCSRTASNSTAHRACRSSRCWGSSLPREGRS